MNVIVYFVVAGVGCWCVTSRGFGWRFADRKAALHFALHTARDFAGETGRATAVRLQRADGSMRELLAFAGIARLPTFAWPRPVRHR